MIDRHRVTVQRGIGANWLVESGHIKLRVIKRPAIKGPSSTDQGGGPIGAGVIIHKKARFGSGLIDWLEGVHVMQWGKWNVAKIVRRCGLLRLPWRLALWLLALLRRCLLLAITGKLDLASTAN